MSDEQPDVNAAILAELKSINENLSYIRAVANQYAREKNAQKQSLQELANMIPRLPGQG